MLTKMAFALLVLQAPIQGMKILSAKDISEMAQSKASDDRNHIISDLVMSQEGS